MAARHLLWAAALAAVACGGGSGGSGPSDDGPRSGVVRVDNRTGYAVEVAWLRSWDEGGAVVARTVVAAGSRASVEPEPLPAGTRLELDLVLLVPAGEGLRVRRKAAVTVDGDADVVLELEEADEPFSLRAVVVAAP